MSSPPHIPASGDFADSYLTGNNSKIVATDSMKNTVYVLAKENNFTTPGFRDFVGGRLKTYSMH